MAQERKARLTLDGAPSSVREARRFIRKTLAGWGAGTFEELATLLVSELATNVVLHARSACEVQVRLDAAELRVAVHDRNPRLPTGKRYGVDATTGRGLALLASLSASWGAEPTPSGKSVWFVLDASSLDASSRAASSRAAAETTASEASELDLHLPGQVAGQVAGEVAGEGRSRRARPPAGVL